MSSVGIKDRISDYYLSPCRLRSNLMMGCASSQSSGLPPGNGTATADPEKLAADSSTATEASADKYPPAEAFVISLDDVDNDNDNRSDSLIKKHPPKRLQKLVEQAATAAPTTTIESLEEKLAKAEVRRQQYIQQRIENIITVTSKGANTMGGSDDGGDGDGNGNGNGEGDGDNDQNDDQKDDKTAIVPSSSNSSQDGADVVVQPTTSNESADKHVQIGADSGADNKTTHS